LLKDLRESIRKYDLKNIQIIKTSGEIEIPLKDDSIDVFLLFDIMHLIEEDERKLLIEEISRVLKKGGIVSYHATHIDGIEDNFIKEIHKMMKQNGFILSKTLQREMFHWSWIQDSYIFNYKRKEKDTKL